MYGDILTKSSVNGLYYNDNTLLHYDLSKLRITQLICCQETIKSRWSCSLAGSSYQIGSPPEALGLPEL
jgi:hypothetical protein